MRPLAAAMATAGQVWPEIMMWANGRSEWQPLSAIHELAQIAELAKAHFDLAKAKENEPK